MSKTFLSGVKPTGQPHLGNYFGAIRQFIKLQNEYPGWVMIADLHALTTTTDPSALRRDTQNLLIDYLALGLDPAKVIIFRQSAVPEHTELAWIFACLATTPYLTRAHAYKDALANGREPSAGLFTYPLLMAADILLYDVDLVPVGKDQKQHLEIARDLAEKFNRIYGETFRLPEPLIMPEVETVPGLDGRKMSKSYGNTIPLFAADDEVANLVMKIPTDSRAVGEPKDEQSSLYQIYKLFTADNVENGTLGEKFLSGGVGYQEFKENLISVIQKFAAPLRAKRAEIATDQKLLERTLENGANAAHDQAASKMAKVRRLVGLY